MTKKQAAKKLLKSYRSNRRLFNCSPICARSMALIEFGIERSLWYQAHDRKYAGYWRKQNRDQQGYIIA